MILSNVITQLLGGMVTSVEIFVLTLLFSLPLGLAVAGGRMSSFGPLRWLMKIYISIMRGTPLMLQLIVVFFAPYYLFGISLSSDYRFFVDRVGYCGKMFDLVRLDHFRAFDTYWKIPASEETAMVGEWIEAPGKEFFTTLLKKYPDLDIIVDKSERSDLDVVAENGLGTY